MAWIESHQELARHPKTKKLARLLGTSTPAAIGHLHLFWWWAMDFAQDGNISQFDPEDVTDAVEWTSGNAQSFIESMVKSGFLDETEDGLLIHDWHDYVGRLLEKREQNRERKRKSRAKSGDLPDSHSTVTRQSQGQSSDVNAGHRATVPNRTVPNQTIPNKIKPKKEQDLPPESPNGGQPQTDTMTSSPSIRAKKEEVEKIKYADFVFLTPDEYRKLTDKMGEVTRDRFFLRFASWISGQTKRVQQQRSAYLTILNWYSEEEGRATGPPQKRGSGSNGRSGNGKPVIPIVGQHGNGGKKLTEKEQEALMESIIAKASKWEAREKG